MPEVLNESRTEHAVAVHACCPPLPLMRRSSRTGGGAPARAGREAGGLAASGALSIDEHLVRVRGGLDRVDAQEAYARPATGHCRSTSGMPN
ncbi:hypothetical protein GCM10010381_40700 [Streptomyces xantholiticus]|nr:hypothetical protein GCM10010381_40700 [Streptomyces xantholiticus]